MEQAVWLPVVFAGLMGLSMLIYACLDGYDLGVGVLLRWGDDEQKDTMIASIGPFWDANETWLVLGIGLLLVAFPVAHGAILTALYIPVATMLVGLILRGVAFDFRAKAQASHKHAWDFAFFAGSLLAALSQGFMLGQYIIGFHYNLLGIGFSAIVALCLVAAYALIGACWLILKTESALQKKAVLWARWALWGSGAGAVLVSAATPLANPQIFEKWFSFPNIVLLAPIPIMTGGLFLGLELLLRRLPRSNDAWAWAPFAATIGIYCLCFYGLAYSFFPHITPQYTIWQAASAPESLIVIFWGAIVVLPAILGYTFLSYRIFRGKAGKLDYY